MTRKISIFNLSNIGNEDYVLKHEGAAVVIPPGGRHDIVQEAGPIDVRLEPSINEKKAARHKKPSVRAYLDD